MNEGRVVRMTPPPVPPFSPNATTIPHVTPHHRRATTTAWPRQCGLSRRRRRSGVVFLVDLLLTMALVRHINDIGSKSPFSPLAPARPSGMGHRWVVDAFPAVAFTTGAPLCSHRRHWTPRWTTSVSINDHGMNNDEDAPPDHHDDDGPRRTAAALHFHASQLTIRPCMASACAQQQQRLQLDESAILAAFWSRRHACLAAAKAGPDAASSWSASADPSWMAHIRLDESRACLGSCPFAPCVGIEHAEYDGPVALDGMAGDEWASRLFRRVTTDAAVDRIWSLVQQAVQQLASEEHPADDDRATKVDDDGHDAHHSPREEDLPGVETAAAGDRWV